MRCSAVVRALARSHSACRCTGMPFLELVKPPEGMRPPHLSYPNGKQLRLQEGKDLLNQGAVEGIEILYQQIAVPITLPDPLN
jgi:hypothetical protein